MNRHEAESLAGLLSFCARVVRLGRTLFTQSLFLFIAKHPAYNCQIKISKNLKADLRWWNELLPQFNGIRLLNDLNHVTDASNLGLGALLPDKLAEHTCRHPRAASICHSGKKSPRGASISISRRRPQPSAHSNDGDISGATPVSSFIQTVPPSSQALPKAQSAAIQWSRSSVSTSLLPNMMCISSLTGFQECRISLLMPFHAWFCHDC